MFFYGITTHETCIKIKLPLRECVSFLEVIIFDRLVWHWNLMIDGFLRLFHVRVALNKSFIFSQLKMLQKTNNCFVQKNARAKWTQIHFFGSYESSHDTNSIFLKAKNAQVRTNSNCGKLNVSKNGSPIFYKRKRYTKVLFNINVFSKKWGQALCACMGPPGPTPFFWKKHFYWKELLCSVCVCKKLDCRFWRHLACNNLNLCVSEHF